MTNPISNFMWRESENSMRDAGILDGGYVVVDRSLKPGWGDVVIAVIDGQASVKGLRRSSHGTMSLRFANPDMPPAFIKQPFYLSLVDGLFATAIDTGSLDLIDALTLTLPTEVSLELRKGSLLVSQAVNNAPEIGHRAREAVKTGGNEGVALTDVVQRISQLCSPFLASATRLRHKQLIAAGSAEELSLHLQVLAGCDDAGVADDLATQGNCLTRV